MKKIEAADLQHLGASPRAIAFYSGGDMISAIYQGEDKYIATGIDGKTVYASAAELIADLEAAALADIKTYRIMPEYYDLWGVTEDTDAVTEDEIVRLAQAWSVDINTLMDQVEET